MMICPSSSARLKKMCCSGFADRTSVPDVAVLGWEQEECFDAARTIRSQHENMVIAIQMILHSNVRYVFIMRRCQQTFCDPENSERQWFEHESVFDYTLRVTRS